MNADKVLALHNEGVSNREIARRLGRETQESTVRGIIARSGSAKKYVRRTATKNSNSKDSWQENLGKIPVPVGTKVKVLHRDGNEYTGEAGVYGYAHDWSLGGRSHAGDILKWKMA